MFAFILESIGTSELMLIGLLALIFLGPRKLPELAKKAGKIMQEFRGTANEFKETWQREVDFAEEAKALDISSLDEEPVARVDSLQIEEPTVKVQTNTVEAPMIKEADPEMIEKLKQQETSETSEMDPEPEINDRKNWL